MGKNARKMGEKYSTKKSRTQSGSSQGAQVSRDKGTSTGDPRGERRAGAPHNEKADHTLGESVQPASRITTHRRDRKARTAR